MTISVGSLLAAVVAAVLAAVGVTVVLPASDAEVKVLAVRPAGQAAEGERAYREQGCWYCHTQQVRAFATEAGLGNPTQPVDVAGQQPSLLGSERTGPDLAHASARVKDLRAAVSGHDGFGYLTDAEVDALAAYLATKR